MAPIVYSSEGDHLRSVLWRETLEEFSFAGVEDILNEVNSDRKEV